MDLAACVSRYIRQVQPHVHKEWAFYRDQPDLPAAIKIAAMCIGPNGRKHPHQYRIPRQALADAKIALLRRQNEIEKSPDFEDLHGIVASTFHNIRGLGKLTVYDTALRLGLYLKLEPQKVYLHAGALIGARALGYEGDVITRDQFQPPLAQLSAAEVEAFLCIYKAQLRGEATLPTHSGATGGSPICYPKTAASIESAEAQPPLR